MGLFRVQEPGMQESITRIPAGAGSLEAAAVHILAAAAVALWPAAAAPGTPAAEAPLATSPVRQSRIHT